MGDGRLRRREWVGLYICIWVPVKGAGVGQREDKVNYKLEKVKSEK